AVAVAVEDEAGADRQREAFGRVQRVVLLVPAPAQAECELRAEAVVAAQAGDWVAVGVVAAGGVSGELLAELLRQRRAETHLRSAQTEQTRLAGRLELDDAAAQRQTEQH